jgi:hypothetical protein
MSIFGVTGIWAMVPPSKAADLLSTTHEYKILLNNKMGGLCRPPKVRRD